jgi:hypothetical protein
LTGQETPRCSSVLSHLDVNFVTDCFGISIYSNCEQALLSILFGRTPGPQAQGHRPAIGFRLITFQLGAAKIAGKATRSAEQALERHAYPRPASPDASLWNRSEMRF